VNHYKEDYKNEKINEHFRNLSSDYTDKQKNSAIKHTKSKRKIEELKNSLTNVEQFIEKSKRYKDAI